MAEPRRPPRSLRDTIQRVLEEAGRPVRAIELRELVGGQGFRVAPSLVFRAVRELIDRRAIRKILVARGYAPGGGERMITLFCRRCGEATEIACDPAFEALDRLAAAADFAASRHIVEVAGVCRECAVRDGDP
jgi:Fur family zinc uptake transcriptional regulator